MATATKTTSAIQEIVELGGEITAKGLSKEQFFQLTAHFPELLMEREKNGIITIMTPVKGGSGFRENNLSYYLTHWVKTQQKGIVFSPSTGFNLPDGSTKSPDLAWISSEKIAQLSPEQIENEFISIVPDFIVELRSKTDGLKKVKQKMTDTWVANGVRLAWMIDPYQEKTHIYRSDGSVEIVEGFDQKLSGEDILSGFELDLLEFKLLSKK